MVQLSQEAFMKKEVVYSKIDSRIKEITQAEMWLFDPKK
jgi:hypothetical protein